MTITGLTVLRALFTERYGALRASVARRLGMSAHMADDALHEAYVRLADKDGLMGVTHPHSYVVNTAVNVAIDRIRHESRQLSDSEIENFLEVPDETPEPDQVAGGRQQWTRMHAALQALPPRQLDILIAIRVDGMTRTDLAKRWGISERQVSRDLLAAHAYCVRLMGERDE